MTRPNIPLQIGLVIVYSRMSTGVSQISPSSQGICRMGDVNCQRCHMFDDLSRFLGTVLEHTFRFLSEGASNSTTNQNFGVLDLTILPKNEELTRRRYRAKYIVVHIDKKGG